MNDESPAENETLDLRALERVNRVCVDFEAAWKNGKRPRIEDFLAETQGLERSLLLYELLVLELEYRQQQGESPSPAEYQHRFRLDARKVDLAFSGGRESPRPYLGEDTAALRQLPRAIGRFEIQSVLAGGGMGVLYLGRDPELERRVVVKTVRDELGSSPNVLARLVREAKIGGRLDHPGICPVLDLIFQEGRHFLVIPYIEGESLGERLTRARHLREEAPETAQFWMTVADQPAESRKESAAGRVKEEESGSVGPSATYRGDLRGVVRLVENIAHAVHSAHEGNILHRDLKPDNIMLRSDGQPVVLDFGLAQDASSQSARLTQEGDVLGTPLYMAPEQVEGMVSSINQRTDVYALGVILYELLTLKTPYEGPTTNAIFQRILKGEPVLPRKLNPVVPRDLEAVCLKAMSRDPELRYPTALAFAVDLRRVRTLQPTIAKPLSTLGRVWRRVRRHPWVAAVLVVCGVLVIASAVLGNRWWKASRATNYYEVASSVLVAVVRGERPRPEHVTALKRFLSEETVESFLRNPSGEWDGIKKALDNLRTVREPAPGERLLGPRAAVTELAPVFRFQVPKPGGEQWHYLLTLSTPELPDRTYEIVQGPEELGPLAFRLPAGDVLASGRHYVWSVRLDRRKHSEYYDLYRPPPATFTVKDAGVRASLAEIPASSHETVDRLLRAAALAAHYLAEDVLAELADFPDDATPAERAYCAFLRAEALARLRDVEGFDMAVSEFEKVTARMSASPTEQNQEQ